MILKYGILLTEQVGEMSKVKSRVRQSVIREYYCIWHSALNPCICFRLNITLDNNWPKKKKKKQIPYMSLP